MIEQLKQAIPVFVVILTTTGVVMVLRHIFQKNPVFSRQHSAMRHIVILLLVAAGIVGVMLTLPFRDENLRTNLTQLLGVVVGAAIALSSTTFVGNAMAGFMLRVVRNFKSGDYVQVGDHCGRVSEQGIFHTEIQTETSDLTTLPNLYLITNPVTVLRENGTILAATVSLGYDIPRSHVEKALSEAAERTGLRDMFVQTQHLGDFSVTFRCGGLLPEVKNLIAARARLRANMLDCLHEANVEIVSPSFVNRRLVPEGKRFLPPKPLVPEDALTSMVAEAPPESVVFDKAEQAASLEETEHRIEEMIKETAVLRKTLSAEKDETLKRKLERDISRNEVYQTHLQQWLQAKQKDVHEHDETIL